MQKQKSLFQSITHIFKRSSTPKDTKDGDENKTSYLPSKPSAELHVCETSAPIGAWKFNFPHLRPTDQPTNRRTWGFKEKLYFQVSKTYIKFVEVEKRGLHDGVLVVEDDEAHLVLRFLEDVHLPHLEIFSRIARKFLHTDKHKYFQKDQKENYHQT